MIKKLNKKASSMGRINIEIPISDLQDLKILAAQWKCAGLEHANVSNFVRASIKSFITTKDVQKFKESMRK